MPFSFDCSDWHHQIYRGGHRSARPMPTRFRPRTNPCLTTLKSKLNPDALVAF
ncbi:MAG TPA: hypothetical protein VF528_02125 [Pyrinomonadaceae bacterium]